MVPGETKPAKLASGSDLVRSNSDEHLRDELIPDHALPADGEDLFDHDDYVDRLVDVIQHASIQHTSANVALFGSWGSGKSGVANRLRARLKEQKHLHYSDFDAFKFARTPLLRNFLTRLANELLEEEGRQGAQEGSVRSEE